MLRRNWMLTTAGLAAAPRLTAAEDPVLRLEAWRKATLSKDVAALEEILHEHLLFGHSNGRLESKEEFIAGIRSGNPVYEVIEIGQQTMVNNRETALLRGAMKVTNVRAGVRNTWKINVLHVWILEKRQWRLIGRQATRLES
jgi:hypothetical protein